MNCPQPGCAGRIVDGYCDICGLPGRSNSGPAPAPTPSWRADDVPASTELGLGYCFVAPAPMVDPAQAIIEIQPPPPLPSGTLVAEQYQVVGCLAKGGMGWIYLARDNNVSGRWVVLKGIDPQDEDARLSAAAEKKHLASLDHPGIVGIYNVAEHRGSTFIVMEYVGGRSLAQYRKELSERTGSPAIPYDDALSLLIGIVPALAYLHDQGLIYCDLKPDNIIQVGDSVRLIDLGSVRHLNDPESPIFGTVAYQAPEMTTTGPAVATDIYALGKTLQALVEGQSAPKTIGSAVNELIGRCCAEDPAARFVSVRQFQAEAIGVLRLLSGKGQPDEVQYFTPAQLASFAVTAAGLPQPTVATAEWAKVYAQGLAAFDAGSHLEAERFFAQVVAFLPGQTAPRLALAFAQIGTSAAQAATAFESLAALGGWIRVPALIGLALARRAQGDIPGAISALELFRPADAGQPQADYYRVLWQVELATTVAETQVPIPPEFPVEWQVQLAIAATSRAQILRPDRAGARRLDELKEQQQRLASWRQ